MTFGVFAPVSGFITQNSQGRHLGGERGLCVTSLWGQGGGWAGSQHPAALDGMQTCVWDKGQAHTSSARVHSHTPRRCAREKSKSGPGCPTFQTAQRHRGGREERTVRRRDPRTGRLGSNPSPSRRRTVKRWASYLPPLSPNFRICQQG